MCKGLVVGFWPWATTSNSKAPSIVDNSRLQRIKNPDHLKFISEQRDEEIRLYRFSPAFKTLSPGMTTIPLWVVPKPHSDKLRLVVDHSAGDFAPNSYISPEDASVHLDTLHALGEALLYIRNHHGNVPLVLFKTDVSQAYRRLPMHPLWQMRQIVSIQDSYHVDNNNNFGNRGAGRLWVTFFSLVLWIAVRLESGEVGTKLQNTLGGGKTQESGNAEGAGKRKCGRRGKAEMQKERKCGKRNVIG